jgi:hypothetical protein
LLGGYPGVRENVVLAREDAVEDQRLIAYIVADPAASVGPPDLREYLRPKLPSYMIPSAFVMLERLPLTENGKVNRAALPAPDQQRPELAQSYLAPRNEVERELVGIWQEVLNVERVGVNDNFFELGGHSLLATRVISRMRQTFKVDFVALVSFFENPTIAGLARSIGDSREAKLVPATVPSNGTSHDLEEFQI